MRTYRGVNRTTAQLLTCLFVLCAAAFSSSAQGQETATQQRHAPGKPVFVVIPRGNSEEALQQAAVATNVPLWSSSFKFNGSTFNYAMVGTNPASGSVATKIPVVIIPIRFQFGSTVIRPGQIACGDTQSALFRIKSSPLLRAAPFVVGVTNVGTTQYIDAFQRANFWSDVSTTSPGYHVKLNPVSTTAGQTIVVPTAVGGLIGAFCGNQQVGTVDINYFDNIAQGLITKLGIPPTSLPLFIAYDVFETIGGGCCVLGYHSSTASNQTYAVATYNDPGIFQAAGIRDVHALSHELGEWMDDPFGNNMVPAWGHVGQVGGCQDNLEVGDPVTGSAFTVTLNGFTYHPEDLVFFSWFARETPSRAVNGQYTFLNAFSGPQAVCH